MVLKYIGFKRKSCVSTGSTFSALTVKREIQKKTAFDPGILLLFESTQIQLDFIRFLEGCSAPIHCNLNYGTFHENPALGLIAPRKPGLYGT